MDHIDASLVMLVRNRATLLPLSLSHLELQTHPAGRFEILVVDMASTDDTREVLERYAAGAPVPTRRLPANTTSPPKACNLALKEAHGRWVLFLDGDLLAGPRLVESHLRAQERHGGHCAIVGAIQDHPQIAANTFTKHYTLERTYGFLKGQPLRFIDWRAWNLSVSRRAVLDAGGFDETFELPGLEDLELAWRLESGGMRGYFCEEAAAFTWCPTTLAAETQRLYAEGYALPTLIRKTEPALVTNRLLLPLQTRVATVERPLLGLYRRMGNALAPGTRSCGFMCRRVLVHSFLKGYRDARAGRPARLVPE